MRHLIPRFGIALAALLIVAAPGLAGGGAPSAELDAPPDEVRAGQPIQIGFMVLLHGEMPFDEIDPELSAIHEQTKETVRAEAIKEPEPGHFSVEVTFPRPGRWLWEIVLEEMGATTFAPLDVLTATGARVGVFPAVVADPEQRLPAVIRAGHCGALGEEVAGLAELGMAPASAEAALGEAVGSAAAAPAKLGETSIAVPLADLIAGERAIVVFAAGGESMAEPLACGEIGGRLTGDRLAFGLRPVDGSGLTGIAVLRGEGERTMVSTFVTALPVPEVGPALVAGPAVAVEVADFAFGPAEVEVAAGTTVTWTNYDGAAHSIAFDDMALADSSLIGQGDVFSQTFEAAGTYAYHCAPHPDMRGTIVVT